MAFTLRLTAETERQVKRRAKRAGVSVNQQIENELRDRLFTEQDTKEWGSRRISIVPNPPYVLENMQHQLDREWEKFKTDVL